MAGYCFSGILPHSDSRWWLVVAVAGFGFLVILAGACASSVMWVKVKALIAQRQIKKLVIHPVI
jgi:hypothetical protein